MNFKALLKSNNKLIFKFCLLIGCFLIMTLFIFNNESFYKRTIIKITDISTSNAGVNTSPTGKTENTFVQNIKAKILNGKYKGHTVSFDNSYSESEITSVKYNKGDKLFASIKKSNDNLTATNISPKRDSFLFLLIGMVMLLLIFTSGRLGFLTIISVIINICSFIYCMNFITEDSVNFPVWICEIILFTVVTLILVSGFHIKTLGAIISTLASVLIIAALYYVTIYANGDLPYDMQQYEVASLPLKDIFFLSSLLGLLGAVMDNAITINTAVSEIVATNPSVSYSKLVNSIYEIIYDVMGTMINVLFFAYLSSSLPIIILKLSNGYNLISVFTIDYIFDIVRFLIGSIGIVISLPISGIIAVLLFKKGFRKCE
ncbi:YibE/F family protein [Eubacterium sp. LFL-14]|uniref:YibE/F family protein n=2 Tax=Eubacterium TaxID=1730 RepID=A0ABT2M0S0_9FIRM|nr:YibE/F family protein [Eubacterium sp. LFL-14]MCT7399117.1 YibE/F family protein [Eubacterium sp. LFL-14]